jgi:uncharacterized protein (TIRG00374 family)
VLLVERGHGVPRATAIAAMTLDKLLELTINFSFLAVSVLAVVRWRLLSEANGGNAAVLLGALACLPLGYLLATSAGRHPFSALFDKLAALFLSKRPTWQTRFNQAARTIRVAESQAGRFYRQAPGMLLLAITVSLAGWLLMFLEYWLMVAFLGLRLTIPQLVAALTAARIANLLLLPAGLGALEASQIVAFGMLGLDPTAGLTASLLIRGRDTFLAALGLAFGTYRLRAGLKAIRVENVD